MMSLQPKREMLFFGITFVAALVLAALILETTPLIAVGIAAVFTAIIAVTRYIGIALTRVRAADLFDDKR